MYRLYKLFIFWLCIITIGGILSFSDNSVYAKITLSEQSGILAERPSISIKFGERSDIDELDEALDKVLNSLKKHSGCAMCPYEFLRSMFVNSFKNATEICFFGNRESIVDKVCEIFVDIILRSSNTSKCDSLLIISLNYGDVIRIFYDSIITVVKDAARDNIREIEVACGVDGMYKLII